MFPPNWQSSITSPLGQVQRNVDPLSLLPSRRDLSKARLDMQQTLMDSGIDRFTPIQVTVDGVIWDGHHAVRVAAKKGLSIAVLVVQHPVRPTMSSILDLPVG